jgi:hypothetical protein
MAWVFVGRSRNRRMKDGSSTREGVIDNLGVVETRTKKFHHSIIQFVEMNELVGERLRFSKLLEDLCVDIESTIAGRERVEVTLKIYESK